MDHDQHSAHRLLLQITKKTNNKQKQLLYIFSQKCVCTVCITFVVCTLYYMAHFYMCTQDSSLSHLLHSCVPSKLKAQRQLELPLVAGFVENSCSNYILLFDGNLLKEDLEDLDDFSNAVPFHCPNGSSTTPLYSSSRSLPAIIF